MDTQQNWERKALENIALAGIKEQKRGRRWNIFFKLLFFAYVTFIIVTLMNNSEKILRYDVLGQQTNVETKAHIAMVRLTGVIAADKRANAEYLSTTLREAMSKPHVKGVLLVANSPGGSPVQSSLVYKTIQATKERYDKPIITVVTDTCASGCYYIASATDEIYADESSIVGSIGVISQSFGYGEAAKKLGIDPRTFTAGDSKDFLNPAKPVTAEDQAFLEGLLDDLHQNFINAVKTGRGKRLSNDDSVFSGLFWAGKKAQDLGLIDGIATPIEVSKKLGGYPVYDYMAQDPIEKVLERFGATAQQAVSSGIDQMLTPKQQFRF